MSSMSEAVDTIDLKVQVGISGQPGVEVGVIRQAYTVSGASQLAPADATEQPANALLENPTKLQSPLPLY